MSGRAIAAAAVLIALALWAGLALTRLTRAEAAYQRAAEAAALPRLSLPEGQAVIAPGSLARQIGDAGAAAGVRLSLTPLPAPIDGVAAQRIVARGSEAALLRFSASVEQGAPLIRWTRWSIQPDGDGGLRLTADAAAPGRSTRASATGPIVALAATPPPALPGRSLFESPITGDSFAPGETPQLIGIAGRLPDDAVALLRLGNGTTRSLRRGESAEGWTVAAIAADRIRLTRAGRDHVEILPPTSADQ